MNHHSNKLKIKKASLETKVGPKSKKQRKAVSKQSLNDSMDLDNVPFTTKRSVNKKARLTYGITGKNSSNLETDEENSSTELFAESVHVQKVEHSDSDDADYDVSSSGHDDVEIKVNSSNTIQATAKQRSSATKTELPSGISAGSKQSKKRKLKTSTTFLPQSCSDSESSDSDDSDISDTEAFRQMDKTQSRQITEVNKLTRVDVESMSGFDSASAKDNASEDDMEMVSQEDTEADELTVLKKELANIPLEDLMKVKEKLGLKVFNKIMHGDTFKDKKEKVFKRANKNRPMEVSSKRRVPILRQKEVRKEKVRRDPRFDDLSGEFQDKHFMKNYAFLTDVKAKEKLLIQKKMKKTTNEEKKQELAGLLKRMTQQEQAEEQKRQRRELEEKWKTREKQLVKEGKTPYFLKKAEKKKLLLAEKFKELQKSGKMDKYMHKKMKKQAQKERKKMPERHQRFQ